MSFVSLACATQLVSKKNVSKLFSRKNRLFSEPVEPTRGGISKKYAEKMRIIYAIVLMNISHLQQNHFDVGFVSVCLSVCLWVNIEQEHCF